MQDLRQKATFLAATSRHSGYWLSALPITACGLRLDNEAIRVAVAMRLGLSLCVPHECQCGANVDVFGSHAFVCKKAPGRITRHQAFNDVIARAVTSAGVPVMKEPTGLTRSDGKRPDGLTLVPWQSGKAMTWDVTVVTTLAQSYVAASANASGTAAESAASRKTEKYADLQATHIFQPIALETLGPINVSAAEFISELGRRTSLISGETREGMFLLQRLSIMQQRYNAILLHQSFVALNDPDL